MSANKWQGRIFLGRDDEQKQRYHWVGRFRTKKERDEEVARERVRIEEHGCDCDDCKAMGRKGVASTTAPKIGHQVDRYLADYRKKNRRSSHDTQTGRLARLKADHGDRAMDAFLRPELKDWIAAEGDYEDKDPVPVGHIPGIVSFYNWSIVDDEVEMPKGLSPARGLSEKRTKGRSEDKPPTEEEFQRLIDACAVHGDYEQMMRATFLFAAFQLARPSEIIEAKESDLDFTRKRFAKSRRLYRGEVDEPKTGKKLTALTKPAHEAIAPILPGDGGFILRNKSGDRLTYGSLHGYWEKVLIRAGLDFDFYLATKHYGVWYFWNVLGLDKQVIAAQAGWQESTVDDMLKVYGHGDVGALDKIDKAFENQPAAAQGLRVIQGGQR